jgi:hypothetical protein
MRTTFGYILNITRIRKLLMSLLVESMMVMTNLGSPVINFATLISSANR